MLLKNGNTENKINGNTEKQMTTKKKIAPTQQHETQMLQIYIKFLWCWEANNPGRNLRANYCFEGW